MRHEDEHLLVVAKPAGVNTHRADAHAQDGMYEWVQRQRPGVELSILHRLDKATSGLLVFGKSTLANRSLAAQLERRRVDKRYELLAAADARRPATLHDASAIARSGSSELLEASTDFELKATGPRLQHYQARPHSGRTHQVRVHAARLGLPILGDDAHGGPAAARLFLHAAELGFEHPSGGPLRLAAPVPPSFERLLVAEGERAAIEPELATLVAGEARSVLFDPEDTDAYLLADRHHDGFPGVRLERLGDVARVLSYAPDARELPADWVDAWCSVAGFRAVYEQRRPRGGGAESARRIAGSAAGTDRFEVLELGCRYLVDLTASATSSGLFLDQRETRRRLLHEPLAGSTVLNAFAHTGSLSVAAAVAGAETLSLDLSQRYLDWARTNLRLNGIDPGDHDFIYGDALDWMRRLAAKGRSFDLVLVDPPSASTSRRGGGRWSVASDLHVLVERAAGLCRPGGTLFVSTNFRRMTWPKFLEHVERGLAGAGRAGTVETQTLPLDHRSGPGDPPYLKAAWVALD